MPRTLTTTPPFYWDCRWEKTKALGTWVLATKAPAGASPVCPMPALLDSVVSEPYTRNVWSSALATRVRPGGVVGLTYCPVKAEIVGSNPIRVAKIRHEIRPLVIIQGPYHSFLSTCHSRWVLEDTCFQWLGPPPARHERIPAY